MAKVFDGIDERLADWIARQPLFFVGSAPLDADGHVNVSPKGTPGSLKVLGPTRVAYLDVVGSGAETIAHVRENGRIVVMFCAFEGPPRIVRLHGRGEILAAGTPAYEEHFAELGFDDPSAPEARRAIVTVEVLRVSDSCGYNVPLMRYEEEREHLRLAAAKRLRTQGPDAYTAYKAQHNARSLDGLPAVD